MASSGWAVLAALAIGLVFVVSGVAKLAAPGQWRSQSAALGVSWAIARVVPYVELTLGALLVVQWHRSLVAWCAVALLVAFTTLMGVRMAQGSRPPCACFGTLRSKPIGPATLLRNALLIAIAVAAAVL